MTKEELAKSLDVLPRGKAFVIKTTMLTGISTEPTESVYKGGRYVGTCYEVCGYAQAIADILNYLDERSQGKKDHDPI